MARSISAGTVYEQTDIPFYQGVEYSLVSQEPMRDVWIVGKRVNGSYDGSGRFEIRIVEIVETMTSGSVAIYERFWFAPDGEQIGRARRRYVKISSLRGLLSRRRMTHRPGDQQ